MSGHLRRPARRRLVDALRACLAPVTACAVALGGLTAWAGSGQAGSPARIEVRGGQALLPYVESGETAVFFRIANSGGSDDQLVAATMTGTDEKAALTRHRATGHNAAYRYGADSVTVPAGSGLTMSPHGVAVTLRAEPGWRAGDRLPFTLHFRHGGRVETTAVVVRPHEYGE
ncbi:copper chaperone PCu(A)C [Streptomyces sp. HUAS TT7]|uniref:copper chaperone PCu(A)C n=1 Tax=Streptomyces sp. HUAS TT7 TaxID=3447507 RepID=UPI003F65D9BD